MRNTTHVLLILAALLPHAHGLAREIAVAPAPNGGAVLGKAIESAEDGDTVLLAKGIYRETVTITKRVQLKGEEGAIIDPSEPLKVEWAAAPEIGKGAYTFGSERKPYALMLDGKIVAEIDQRRAEGEKPWHWKTLLAVGPPLGKWKYVRALWMYDAKKKKAFVHLADDAEPAGKAWTVLWNKDAVVTFSGAKGAGISGVTLAHGYRGVVLQEHSSQCAVSNCTIGPWEKSGVLVTDDSSECLIEGSRVFRGAYEEWSPAEGSKALYEVWKIHKTVGFYDRVGIELFRAGANNRVHANHVYETFDGINIGDYGVENLDIPLEHPDDGKGTEIWENVIERTRDSGMELGAGCIDVKVHHNTLRLTHGGMRFKLPRVGPVFIYRNLLENGSPFNIWYSMDDSPAEGYVYHNTIVGGDAAVIYSSFSKGGHQIGAPKWHYYNNLFMGKGFFRNWRVNAPVNFTADYNVVVGGNPPWPEDKTKEPHSKYVDDAGPLSKEFHPLAGSPTIDAGMDLSTVFNGKPLPGCEEKNYQGRAPDAGAFESDAGM